MGLVYIGVGDVGLVYTGGCCSNYMFVVSTHFLCTSVVVIVFLCAGVVDVDVKVVYIGVGLCSSCVFVWLIWVMYYWGWYRRYR